MKKLICLLGLCFALNVSAQNPVLNNGKYYSQDKLYSGILKNYNDQNVLVSEANVLNGELHGKITFYFPSGAIMEEGQYAYASKDGQWLRYNETKVVIAKAAYKNGLKHGTWLFYNTTGNKTLEMYYDNGDKTGTWKQYDDEGKLVKEMVYTDYH
jgi:antitoxin component YwqK of YwqJK toxin-antitoxin module